MRNTQKYLEGCLVSEQLFTVTLPPCNVNTWLLFIFITVHFLISTIVHDNISYASVSFLSGAWADVAH